MRTWSCDDPLLSEFVAGPPDEIFPLSRDSPHLSPSQSAQRRLLDVINSVGLSDSLLRMADRRHRTDKLLAYGGMAATLLMVVLLYWYLKM